MATKNIQSSSKSLPIFAPQNSKPYNFQPANLSPEFFFFFNLLPTRAADWEKKKTFYTLAKQNPSHLV